MLGNYAEIVWENQVEEAAITCMAAAVWPFLLNCALINCNK